MHHGAEKCLAIGMQNLLTAANSGSLFLILQLYSSILHWYKIHSVTDVAYEWMSRSAKTFLTALSLCADFCGGLTLVSLLWSVCMFSQNRGQQTVRPGISTDTNELQRPQHNNKQTWDTIVQVQIGGSNPITQKSSCSRFRLWCTEMNQVLLSESWTQIPVVLF